MMENVRLVLVRFSVAHNLPSWVTSVETPSQIATAWCLHRKIKRLPILGSGLLGTNR